MVLFNTENTCVVIDNNPYSQDDLKGLLRLQAELLQEENAYFTIEEVCNIWTNYSNDLMASFLCFSHSPFVPRIRKSQNFTSFIEYSKIQ